MNTRYIVRPIIVILLLSGCSTGAQGDDEDDPRVTQPPPATLTLAVWQDAPYPAGSIGYAISWPQCGGPYPEQPFDFGIIGVNDGKAFTENPCFADQYRWALRGRYHPSIYMNVNYLESTDEFDEWWGCHGNAECHAYRYGWVAADHAFQYAASLDAVAPVWWLDVQIVSDWSQDLTLNWDAVRGARDYLRGNHGLRVGLSSTAYQWATIAGEAAHALPVWDASAINAAQAAEFCETGKDFGGGGTEQIAYVDSGFEVVLACGATHRVQARREPPS
jgi:hypothetical protein